VATSGSIGEHRDADHQQVQLGAPADRVGIADRGRVGRVLQERHQVEHEEGAAGEQQRGSRRTGASDPTVGDGEHDREDPAQREPVDDRGGEQAGALLQVAADRLGSGHLARGLLLLAFEGDRAVDLRLAHELGEAGREQAAAEAGDEPPHEERAKHVVTP
jgi:hypothetical protein